MSTHRLLQWHATPVVIQGTICTDTSHLHDMLLCDVSGSAVSNSNRSEQTGGTQKKLNSNRTFQPPDADALGSKRPSASSVCVHADLFVEHRPR